MNELFLVLPDPRCFVIHGVIAIWDPLGRARVVPIGKYTLCVALNGSVADLLPEAPVTTREHPEALTVRWIVIPLTPN